MKDRDKDRKVRKSTPKIVFLMIKQFLCVCINEEVVVLIERNGKLLNRILNKYTLIIYITYFNKIPFLHK